eukprot:1147695-Pelagomonas_calceolata.AAC.3
MVGLSGHRIPDGPQGGGFYCATKSAVKTITEGLRQEVCGAVFGSCFFYWFEHHAQSVLGKPVGASKMAGHHSMGASAERRLIAAGFQQRVFGGCICRHCPAHACACMSVVGTNIAGAFRLKATVPIKYSQSRPTSTESMLEDLTA